MNKNITKNLISALVIFLLFVIWTVLVINTDVKAVGPQSSEVGFATLNQMFHNATGYTPWLYEITDLLSIIPLMLVLAFGVTGFFQLIKRKSLLKVDAGIISLGLFYVLVAVSFVFFEKVVVNYRPVLIEGVLEASYPSSTTLLVLTVMPTAILELNKYIKSKRIKAVVTVLLSVFTAFMLLGRLVSGVHWLTDIVGGVLLSLSLVVLYCAFVELFEKIQKNNE